MCSTIKALFSVSVKKSVFFPKCLRKLEDSKHRKLLQKFLVTLVYIQKHTTYTLNHNGDKCNMNIT